MIVGIKAIDVLEIPIKMFILDLQAVLLVGRIGEVSCFVNNFEHRLLDNMSVRFI